MGPWNILEHASAFLNINSRSASNNAAILQYIYMQKLH